MSIKSYSSYSQMHSSGGPRQSFRSGGLSSLSSYSTLGMGGRRSLGMGSGIVGGFSGGGFSGSSSTVKVSGVQIGNEKNTMINLNNRLSNYLQQVKNLEKSNTDLELQLKEFHVGTALATIDYAAYDQIIKPLREQILEVHLGNARLALDLDNATLAAKDFQTKYENEFCTRQSVEADIADLKAMKEEYIRNCKDLESDITSAKEELVYLKKNHDEELVTLKQQVTGTVNVSVESASAPDMSNLLAEMRAKYEALCKKNQVEVDAWYKTQVEVQEVQAVQVNQAAESLKVELKELTRRFQSLQADYNSLASANCSLEDAIQSCNDKYAQKLIGLGTTISNLQLEYTHLRDDIIAKSKEYNNLVNIKMQLENEISIYRQLLKDTSVSAAYTGGEETSGVSTTVIKTETTKRTF